MLYSNIVYSKKFCSTKTQECLRLIQGASSFNFVAMPGVGVTFFLKHVNTQSKDMFIFINSYELPEFTKEAFYQQMVLKLGGRPSQNHSENVNLINEGIIKLLRTSKRKVVFVFNRLDRLHKIMDQSFFDNLRFFRDQDSSRIVVILVSSEKLLETRLKELKDISQLYSNTVYMQPYSEVELEEILRVDPSNIIEKTAVMLSGGHHNLYNVLTRCQNLDNALSDSMVELLVKDMYFSLTRRQRDELERVVKKQYKTADEYLRGVGYVYDVSDKQKTFTPLLEEFIKEETSTELPVMEKRLFTLLYVNRGRIVSKEKLFDEVWKESDGIATEWSLNSLVYRLRNHAGFDKSRFLLKSVKKVGYVLYDSHEE